MLRMIFCKVGRMGEKKCKAERVRLSPILVIVQNRGWRIAEMMPTSS